MLSQVENDAITTAFLHEQCLGSAASIDLLLVVEAMFSRLGFLSRIAKFATVQECNLYILSDCQHGRRKALFIGDTVHCLFRWSEKGCLMPNLAVALVGNVRANKVSGDIM